MPFLRFLLELFGTLPRARVHHRTHVDVATRDAISDAEHARVDAWAKAAKLEERRIGIDTGCAGTELRGVELTIPLRGLVSEADLLITEKRRTDHALDALFEDLTLSGSLQSVSVTPDEVKLRFVPRRATEVYDVALRRLAEIVTQMNEVMPNISPEGPYR